MSSVINPSEPLPERGRINAIGMASGGMPIREVTGARSPESRSMAPLARKIPRLEVYLYLPALLTIFPYLGMFNILAAFAPADALKFSHPAATFPRPSLRPPPVATTSAAK